MYICIHIHTYIHKYLVVSANFLATWPIDEENPLLELATSSKYCDYINMFTYIHIHKISFISKNAFHNHEFICISVHICIPGYIQI